MLNSPPYIAQSVAGCGGLLQGDVYTTGPITSEGTVVVTSGIGDGDTVFADGF